MDTIEIHEGENPFNGQKMKLMKFVKPANFIAQIHFMSLHIGQIGCTETAEIGFAIPANKSWPALR